MVMRKKPKRAAPTSDQVVIKIRGLVNAMGGNLIHDHLDLDVKRGEVLGVVGGSGSGKSVLLRSIIGLNKPTDGTIRVFGEDIGELHGMELRALQMRWGVLFQEGALFSCTDGRGKYSGAVARVHPHVGRADGRDRRDQARHGGASARTRPANTRPSFPAA